MAIKFAKRMEGLKGSEIRELLKLTETRSNIFCWKITSTRTISSRGNERNIKNSIR